MEVRMNIISESILVYTPEKPLSQKERVEKRIELQKAACKALGYAYPINLPVGIVILNPGDTLEAVSTKTLSEVAEERAKQDNATDEMAGSEEP